MSGVGENNKSMTSFNLCERFNFFLGHDSLFFSVLSHR